jgi:ribosome-associated translation inhibitor RaiA
MKTALSGDVSMLDRTTREKAAAIPRKILERFSKHIAHVDVHVSHLMPTGSTLCEVTVRLADHVQVMARDRNQDALKAITKALERARVQVSQSVQPARRRRSKAAREVELGTLLPSRFFMTG